MAIKIGNKRKKIHRKRKNSLILLLLFYNQMNMRIIGKRFVVLTALCGREFNLFGGGLLFLMCLLLEIE